MLGFMTVFSRDCALVLACFVSQTQGMTQGPAFEVATPYVATLSAHSGEAGVNEILPTEICAPNASATHHHVILTQNQG